MPQLDTATFRGQVTWLVIVFVVLYLIRTGEILPKRNRIGKLRAKKRERTRGDATQYDGERARIEAGYSARLGNAAGSSHGLLQETIDVQTNWINQNLVKRNESTHLKPVLEKYRSYRITTKLADVYLTRTSFGINAVKPIQPKQANSAGTVNQKKLSDSTKTIGTKGTIFKDYLSTVSEVIKPPKSSKQSQVVNNLDGTKGNKSPKSTKLNDAQKNLKTPKNPQRK